MLLTGDTPKCKDMRAEGKVGRGLVRREPWVCAHACVCLREVRQVILGQETLLKFFKFIIIKG